MSETGREGGRELGGGEMKASNSKKEKGMYSQSLDHISMLMYKYMYMYMYGHMYILLIFSTVVSVCQQMDLD